MKRLCQLPYVVIAILVFLLVNDRITDSQDPNAKAADSLTLTSVKTTGGQKVRLSFGDMVLETKEFHATHSDGTETVVTTSGDKVKLTHKTTGATSARITVPLTNGALGKDHHWQIRLDGD